MDLISLILKANQLKNKAVIKTNTFVGALREIVTDGSVSFTNPSSVAKKFGELREKMSPESQARASNMTKKMICDMRAQRLQADLSEVLQRLELLERRLNNHDTRLVSLNDSFEKRLTSLNSTINNQLISLSSTITTALSRQQYDAARTAARTVLRPGHIKP